MRECYAYGVGRAGLRARSNAQALVENFRALHVGWAGIECAGNSMVSVRGASVVECHRGGVLLLDTATCHAMSLRVHGSQMAGVDVRGRATAALCSCSCTGGNGHGLFVHEQGSVCIHAPIFQHNAGWAVHVSGSANVLGCHVDGTKWFGNKKGLVNHPVTCQ